MNSETAEAFDLGEATCALLRDKALVRAEVVDPEDLPRFRGDFIRAEVRFRGARTGKLTIASPVDTAVEVGKRLTDLASGEDRCARNQRRAAMDEFAKALCRLAVSPHLAGAAIVHTMPPRIETVNHEGWQLLSERSGAVHLMIANAHPAILAFELDD